MLVCRKEHVTYAKTSSYTPLRTRTWTVKRRTRPGRQHSADTTHSPYRLSFGASQSAIDATSLIVWYDRHRLDDEQPDHFRNERN
jgi:hypothetical protein